MTFIVLALLTIIGPQDYVYAESKKIHGIDLSHFNGQVSWEKLTDKKAHIHFIVLKATEGVDYLDSEFVDHWESAKKHGFIRGAYHFFVAHDDPLQEANWYIHNVKLQKGDLFPIIDVERAQKNDKPGLKDRLQKFLAHIEQHYGVPPIVYTGPKFWEQYIGGKIHDGNLWIAQYEVAAPIIPSGWKDWTFWQFTQSASVSGVEKPVDMNLFSGSAQDLRQFVLQ